MTASWLLNLQSRRKGEQGANEARLLDGSERAWIQVTNIRRLLVIELDDEWRQLLT